MIIRPDFSTASLALLAVLLSAAGWGAMGLCNKRLTATDTTEQIVVLNLLMVLPPSVLPSWTMLRDRCAAQLARHARARFPRAGWRSPTRRSACRSTSPGCRSRRRSLTPLFGRLPDLWTVLGALVIFAAAFSIATRERR